MSHDDVMMTSDVKVPQGLFLRSSTLMIRDVNFAENRSAKAGESEKKIFAIRRSEAKANFFFKKRKKATKNRNSAKRKRKNF